MTQHTAGPWTRHKRTIGRFVQHGDGTQTFFGIAMLLERIGETEANGRLLLHAPLLLEACQKWKEAFLLVRDSNDWSKTTEAMEFGHRAICLAMGLPEDK